MARELLRSSNLFREKVTACADELAPHVDWSLMDVLDGSADAPSLSRVDVAHPALFAVMTALAALWQEEGIQPGAVVGHSGGEIAAAHVAGALSLADAVRMVALRSQALATPACAGGMASIALPASELRKLISLPSCRDLSIAVMNAPSSTVVSGEDASLERLMEHLSAEGVRVRRVKGVNRAGHSRKVEAIRAEMMEITSGVVARGADIPFFSTVSGAELDTAALDSEYWYHNLREPVRFESATRSILQAGYRRFVEVSPHPVLVSSVQETAFAAGVEDVTVIGSLRRGEGGLSRFTASLTEVRNATSAQGSRVPRNHRTAVPQTLPALVELVHSEVVGILARGEVTDLANDRALRELGLDSVSALELRNRLSLATGWKLAPTVVFDHPSVDALAEHLHARLAGDTTADPHPEPLPRAAADGDPIAIVAMACRLPGGVHSPEDLWEVLRDGVDVIGPLPANRGWDIEGLHSADPDDEGKTYVRQGGFLHEADRFDAEFFGVSPREATAMDPQQRLMLEVCWEAAERAGIDPLTLRGSRTGVYFGTNGQDYATLLQRAPSGFEGYLATGSTAAVLSGRIAYTLGLVGPAVTVSTACSSSLVALHSALAALRAGECELAFVGGVTVMATPTTMLAFSRQRGISRDGRSKAFGADADGFGAAEGAAVLLVERLSDARRNGHSVLAIVRGSSLNQDGPSNGLTAPSGLAQQNVIRQALADAALRPDDVDLIEAHGTGTALGDPIEASAIMATYGQNRSEGRPVRLGSLKSNIGHTQAAAGVAGIMKVVLAVRHGVMPRTLHVREPSPHVDWAEGDVALLTEPAPWPRVSRPRRAAVSAFGTSGTNAHVIIEEPPHDPAARHEPAPDVPALVPWTLSAKTPAALRAQAARLKARIEADPGLRPTDVGWSLGTTRSAFAHRAVVVARDRDQFTHHLSSLSEGRDSAAVVTGATAGSGRKSAMLFSGQGAQRPGMGRELSAAFPVFAHALDEVCAHLDGLLDRPLRTVMFVDEGTPEAGLLDHTGFTQAALFAFEVAQFRLLEHWGLRPDVLCGHSVGELAAVHVAGVLSLEDACALVAARGNLMQGLSGPGAMVAVRASEDETEPFLRGHSDEVAIAAVNGPSDVVISGTRETVVRIADEMARAGHRTRRLAVSHAFHSPQMDGVLDELRAVAGRLTYRPPVIPIVSGLTGELVSGDELGSADHWVRHAREAVRFGDSVGSLRAAGVTSYVEIGPRPALTPMVMDCLPAEARSNVFSVSSKAPDEVRDVTTALARLHVRGHAVDWHGVFDGRGARRVDLPTYPFQRLRHWLEPGPSATPDGEGGRSPWTYQAVWRPTALSVRKRPYGRWLIAVPEHPDAGGWPAAAAAALAERGAEVIPFPLGEAESDRNAIAARLAAVAGEGALAGVLSFLGTAHASPATDAGVARGLAATVALAQAMQDGDVRAPLWVATKGAVSVGPGDPLDDPLRAQLWGLGRVLALEHPQTWGGLVDLPAEADPHTLAALCDVVAHEGGEDQVALRASGAYVRRLVRPTPSAARGVADWPPKGTILVTGGTGAVATHLARWLARNGADHLVLASRRGPRAPGAAALEAELSAGGTKVTLTACDVTDRGAVEDLITSVPADLPLTAVVHCAGLLDDAVVERMTADRVTTVVRAKASSAWHLHELTRDLDLSAFVLFSAFAGSVGISGQANYAAANAFLDALAEHRHARGLPATAVAWGSWDDGGMAADPAVADRLDRLGVSPMTPETALEVLRDIVVRGQATRTVAALDWNAFTAEFTAVRPSPLLDELVDRQAPRGQADNGVPSFAETLAALPQKERPRALTRLLRTHVAAVLGHESADTVRSDQTFRELGFDSLTAVELRNRLEAATGARLPATLVFDYPSLTSLADHLSETAVTPADADVSVLAELDALDARLSALTPDQELAAKLKRRLQVLLARFDDSGSKPKDLGAATPDEVFAFIDNELGVS